MADGSTGVPRTARRPGFVLGIVIGLLLALSISLIDGFFEMRGRFDVPDDLVNGVEGVRLVATRPDGSIDIADGEARWEVTETAAGPGVRATATIFDRGIEMVLTLAPAGGAPGLIHLDVATEFPRLLGDPRSISA